MATTVLTAEGVRELEEQLEYLKTVARKEVAQEIKEARAFGDLSENAEYEEARNKQSRIEGDILQLEQQLRDVSIIDEKTINTKVVSLGSTVEVQEEGQDEVFSYTIVGSTEANPVQGRLSNESPVGAALLGHAKDDVVEVNTPGGTVLYKIVGIKRG